MTRWLDPRLVFGLVVALYLLAFPYHPALLTSWMSRRLDKERIEEEEQPWHVHV